MTGQLGDRHNYHGPNCDLCADSVRWTTDRYGRQWPTYGPDDELCPECKQPDNCGDCDHTRLWPSSVVALGGRLAEGEQIDRSESP